MRNTQTILIPKKNYSIGEVIPPKENLILTMLTSKKYN